MVIATELPPIVIYSCLTITHLQCSSMKAVKKNIKNKINKSPSLPRYFEDNTELKGKLLVLTSVQ